MGGHSLLAELVVTYALALGLLLLAGWLRVPSIVALIVAGVVAGPAGVGIVKTREEVDLLAEIGIILLLFMVGLEFSLGELRRFWRPVLVGGALQVGLTLVVIGVLAVAVLGLPFRLAVFVGLFVALSSTAIVLRELAQRNELHTLHGRLTTGVLLFQDLAVILLLALQPAARGTMPPSAVVRAILGGVAALALVAGVGWIVLPRLLRVVARLRSRDAFTLAVLLVSVGTAWLTSRLGVSMALGAFLGGLVLGESEFSPQIHAELRPVRDTLASLFFISVGMLLDPPIVWAGLGATLATAAAIIVLKALAAVLALPLAGAPLGVAVVTSLSLAQVGEFSFLLGRAGVEAGLVPADLAQRLLSASVLTMVAAPLLIARAPAIGAWVGRLWRSADAVVGAPVADVAGHVVIFGFGVGGRLLASALRDIGQPYVVVELNAATVREGQSAGEPIFFGDASHPDTLAAAHIDRALAVVAMLSDPDASLRLARVVRGLAPEVPIIVRTRYRAEAERLRQAGATLAVAEELEASLEVVAQLFARLHVPGNLSDVLLDGFRLAATSSRPLRAPTVPLGSAPREIREMPLATHQLEPHAWAVGHTLATIDLRAATGATIIAVRKGEQYSAPPPASLVLEAGDVVFLSGDASDVRLARVRLETGPR